VGGGDPEYIKGQQDVFCETYCYAGSSGSRAISTEGKDLAAVVKDIVIVMYLEPYSEFSFSARLGELR
jgi:hypothetical protein